MAPLFYGLLGGCQEGFKVIKSKKKGLNVGQYI